MKFIITITIILSVGLLSTPLIRAQVPDQKSIVDSLHGQDPSKIINLNEVMIMANRIPVRLKLSSSAVSVINENVKTMMPRTIAADEALKFVPGVRIDNQANGSRIHMSIRGQGILSERGLRGIKVLIDGIPVNDPTGFAPDLYDVDWETVDHIEVIRGSSTALYGGSSSAGILNITTESGGNTPLGGKFYSSFGSNGFYKVLGQIAGTANGLNYRVSASDMGGNGYRDHTGFRGKNISEKIKWKASGKLQLQQILMITHYFNQNAEGLNLKQVNENPKQANPDAIPFNEYQKTDRFTSGINGKYSLSAKSYLKFSGYMRWSKYKETSNTAAQYRYFEAPGGMLQYDLNSGDKEIQNNMAIGLEYQSQIINENKFKSLADTSRVDAMNESNLEDTVMLANQLIGQQGIGIYICDQLQLNDRLNITGSIRYDNTSTKLKDKLSTRYNLSGSKAFNNTTAKLGLAYSIVTPVTLYTSWSQGFIPPATEELVNNPESNSGLNEKLKPATSTGFDLGLRGNVDEKLFYDVCTFYLATKNDFFRFKLTPVRGNQEAFYGNAGNSRRFGMEIFAKYNLAKQVFITIAYTYSDFTYTAPDSLKGLRLPNSPTHQLAADAEYRLNTHFLMGLTSTFQSNWTIYTDVVHKNVIQDGFNLIDARLNYNFKLNSLDIALEVFARNIFNKNYIAFTEPDPDGNCYQPGPGREFFGSLCVYF